MSSDTCSVNFLHIQTPVHSDAMAQLKQVARQLPGMRRCCGMPDLHPGAKFPVGAAFLSDQLHPALVGQDIGCGMTMYRVLDAARGANESPFDAERYASALDAVKAQFKAGVAYATSISAERAPVSLRRLVAEHEHSFGTIGGGNHFAEFQTLHLGGDDDDDAAGQPHRRQATIHADAVYLLVHSGSRTLGEAVLDRFTASGDVEQYLREHDFACEWAAASRVAIAMRVAKACGVRLGEQVLSVCHNSATRPAVGGFLHRKGAAPTDCGLVAIPGSRGALTFIVRPTLETNAAAHADACWSIAHGAGRAVSRKDIQHELEEKFDGNRDAAVAALSRTVFGGFVLYEDFKVLLQEAPEAYKDIDAVIDDLKAHGLVAVVAVMRPHVTCKF